MIWRPDPGATSTGIEEPVVVRESASAVDRVGENREALASERQNALAAPIKAGPAPDLQKKDPCIGSSAVETSCAEAPGDVCTSYRLAASNALHRTALLERRRSLSRSRQSTPTRNLGTPPAPQLQRSVQAPWANGQVEPRAVVRVHTPAYDGGPGKSTSSANVTLLPLACNSSQPGLGATAVSGIARYRHRSRSAERNEIADVAMYSAATTLETEPATMVAHERKRVHPGTESRAQTYGIERLRAREPLLSPSSGEQELPNVTSTFHFSPPLGTACNSLASTMSLAAATATVRASVATDRCRSAEAGRRPASLPSASPCHTPTTPAPPRTPSPPMARGSGRAVRRQGSEPTALIYPAATAARMVATQQVPLALTTRPTSLTPRPMRGATMPLVAVQMPEQRRAASHSPGPRADRLHCFGTRGPRAPALLAPSLGHLGCGAARAPSLLSPQLYSHGRPTVTAMNTPLSL